ncbi:unnamed protein product [Sphagnum troendelagicum]|uniref:Uncharacterized protein n=1 Tax=Sphagnum troendelagicum TaxID=128251 RepID=A0ABP0TLC3_9BRYO
MMNAFEFIEANKDKYLEPKSKEPGGSKLCAMALHSGGDCRGWSRGTGQEMLGNKVSMITVRAIVAEESHQERMAEEKAMVTMMQQMKTNSQALQQKKLTHAHRVIPGHLPEVDQSKWDGKLAKRVVDLGVDT